MQIRARACLVAAALPLAVMSQAAAAQGFTSQDIVPGGEEWLILDLGGIVNRFDSTVRLDGQSGRGTDINLENNDLDRNLSSFEAALTWRFFPRHRFDILYYGGKRSGSRSYTSEIDIGDATFPVGANVTVQAKNQLVDVDYRYSFLREPEYEVAFLVGVYGGQFHYDFDAVGLAGNVQNTYHKSVSTALPLPVLGASIDFYPSKHWRASLELAGMKAKIGDVDGHAYVGGASAEYMFMRGLGVGLRYGWTDVRADVTKSDFNGTLGVKTNAVSAYARLVF
jgi:hypothetical protein